MRDNDALEQGRGEMGEGRADGAPTTRPLGAFLFTRRQSFADGV
jgi:hypothetical protein